MMRPDCLTINEAAELTGLDPQTLRNAIQRKALPVQPERLKADGGKDRVVLAQSDLLTWLAARQEKSEQRQRVLEQKRARQELRASRPETHRPGTKARCNRRSDEWGELLKKTRERMQLNISELGRRASTCQSYISRMEGLGEIPRRDKVLAIAKALQVDPNPFLVVCGYAPEETTQLAQLVQSLSSLQPTEQMQALELTAAYVRSPGPERQVLLSLLRWWQEAPECDRRKWETVRDRLSSAIAV